MTNQPKKHRKLDELYFIPDRGFLHVLEQDYCFDFTLYECFDFNGDIEFHYNETTDVTVKPFVANCSSRSPLQTDHEFTAEWLDSENYPYTTFKCTDDPVDICNHILELVFGFTDFERITDPLMLEEFYSSQEYTKTTVEIWQIRHLSPEKKDLQFVPLDLVRKAGKKVAKRNYKLVYTFVTARPIDLDDLYFEFNENRPEDFKGHSLSVSDVVVLSSLDSTKAYYCDPTDFVEVPEFLSDPKSPDEAETGEIIQTPRGHFFVVELSRQEMEAQGYGIHHVSSDGKYLIMGNGKQAFAVKAEL